MRDFLKLPPEIRLQIYHDCLVVGEVYLYRISYDGNPPAAALLRTCRTIHSEAEPILYQQNTFILKGEEMIQRFFVDSLHDDTRRA